MRPRVSDIRYHGVKKSEREDLEARVGLIKGNQVTPNLIDRAKTLIKRYFDDKGFKNADVIITQKMIPIMPIKSWSILISTRKRK